MLSLLSSVIALGVIIFVHELGHFLFAKLFGVGVIEFSIGMGPRLLSFIKGNTRYSWRILPLGGSCMMLGEEEEEKDIYEKTDLKEVTNLSFSSETIQTTDDKIIVDGREFDKESQFTRKEAWKRFLIIFGGPLFNFIFAFLLSVIVTANAGWDRPLILDVVDDSAAQEAGIEEGDIIVELGIQNRSSSIMTARDIQLFFTANRSLTSTEPVSVKFRKTNGDINESVMYAKYDEETKSYLFGLMYMVYYEPCESVPELIKVSFHNIIYSFRSTIESIRMMIRGDVSRNDVKGVVGMVAIMDETVEKASEYGITDAILTLLNIMLLLSASIGCMNLLPLPALDGGRLVFLLIEMISGKAVPKRVEGIIHAAGTVILLVLMVFILFNDIWNLIGI